MRIGCERHGRSLGIVACEHIRAVLRGHGSLQADVVVLRYTIREDFVSDHIMLCPGCAKGLGLERDVQMPFPGELPAICQQAAPTCLKCLEDALPEFRLRGVIPAAALQR